MGLYKAQLFQCYCLVSKSCLISILVSVLAIIQPHKGAYVITLQRRVHAGKFHGSNLHSLLTSNCIHAPQKHSLQLLNHTHVMAMAMFRINGAEQLIHLHNRFHKWVECWYTLIICSVVQRSGHLNRIYTPKCIGHTENPSLATNLIHDFEPLKPLWIKWKLYRHWPSSVLCIVTVNGSEKLILFMLYHTWLMHWHQWEGKGKVVHACVYHFTSVVLAVT